VVRRCGLRPVGPASKCDLPRWPRFFSRAPAAANSLGRPLPRRSSTAASPRWPLRSVAQREPRKSFVTTNHRNHGHENP
jgi:hypothetical protein